MKSSIPHKTYIALLVASMIITSATLFITDNSWATIVASIGAGGIASVCVAWLLDIRNAKTQMAENQRRNNEVMNQIVSIYRNMMWRAANVCTGYCKRDENHSFKNWLAILNSVADICPKEGQMSIMRRCKEISACVIELQRQVELLQSQNITLIYADYPDIEKMMGNLRILWTHCWGTLNTLEREDYKSFLDTTYILYTDFIQFFPKYKDSFPIEYSVNSFTP